MLKPEPYIFTAKLWLYPGAKASWHFLTLPHKVSKEIKVVFEGLTAGWGSLPVHVTIGKTTWKTSIFPDTKSHAYILPVKADIRKKENLVIDKKILVTLNIIV